MIFNHHNVIPGTRVVDMDTGATLEQVESVDVTLGYVNCFVKPIRLNHLGELDMERKTFRSIYPIYGGGLYPLMFHCYGRNS